MSNPFNLKTPEFYPVPAGTEPAPETAPQLPGFNTVAGLSGHLVMQEFSPTHFSAGGIDVSSNGHRTGTDRIIAETEPLVAHARTTLQVREPETVVINNVAFGANRSESGMHVPEEPPAYQMNARLWIPRRMQVDHDGRSLEILETKERQPLSMDSILELAREQFDSMAIKIRRPELRISPAKAVDDVIRRSDMVLREENVGPAVAFDRQAAEVPSTIDPIRLYGKVVSDFKIAHPSTDEAISSVEPVADVIEYLEKPAEEGEEAPTVERYFDEYGINEFTPQTVRDAVIAIWYAKITDKFEYLRDGKENPLQLKYEAAIKVLAAEWEHRDSMQSEAIQAGNYAIQHERRFRSAQLEHNGAMRRDVGASVLRSVYTHSMHWVGF